MSLIIVTVGVLLVFGQRLIEAKHYEPNWASLDTRPIPEWFNKAKVGVMMHWGVYSSIPMSNEWFWHQWLVDRNDTLIKYMEDNYKPGFTYQEFAKDFTATRYDPEEWVTLFERSGMKYLVLTSKHHDGFTLWPSEYSYSWNAMDVGPHRDLVGELAAAVRSKSTIKFGLYHSLLEWFNPMYESDKNNSFNSRDFVDKKVLPEMKELVIKYQPEYIWSDGHWDAEPEYWRSTEFLAWLYNESPVKDTVIVNDRWGKGTSMKHGDVYNGRDNNQPDDVIQHPWESAMNTDTRSWKFCPDAPLDRYMSNQAVVNQLVSTVSLGGNLLMNIGPNKDGTIPAIFEERLTAVGDFLRINGEAIYDSHSWKHQQDSHNKKVWYAMQKKPEAVYAMLVKLPKNGNVTVADIKEYVDKDSKVSLLGFKGDLKMDIGDQLVNVELPSANDCYELNRNAWVLKFEKN